MQAPPNQSLPLLHRSRSEHTRRAPADRSANFNTSLPPSRPHRMPPRHVYVRGVACELQAAAAVSCIYAYGARECVASHERATETRLACGSGWIVSPVTCACARTTTRMYLTPEGYREAGRREGRRTEKKGCVSTQQEARCSVYTSENGISEDARARYPPINILSP